ncbi:hypothetical protein B5F54_15055 [Anaeromassilibacillus sp. An250]|nr:hypothetical protein B5F54_15055 [Anaeromassilibacillus sp. An250]
MFTKFIGISIKLVLLYNGMNDHCKGRNRLLSGKGFERGMQGEGTVEEKGSNGEQGRLSF